MIFCAASPSTTELRTEPAVNDVARDIEDRSQQVHAHDGGAVVHQVEHSKLLPWLMLTCLLSGAAIVGVVLDMIEQTRTERETRMLEYYVLELDGKLMAARVIEPQQSYSAQKRK